MVSIDCYRDGPLSARDIMRNYLKLNPTPVLMVVRAYGNRQTWSAYKERIVVSHVDQVRFWMESLPFAPKDTAISEAILLGGRMMARERYESVIRTSSESVKVPPGLCVPSIPKWVRWAHVDVADTKRWRGKPAGVDLFLVASPAQLEDLSSLATLTENISRCLPSASVELHARSDPFFVGKLQYPLLNPFYKTPIVESAIRATQTTSCSLGFNGKVRCTRLDPRGL